MYFFLTILVVLVVLEFAARAKYRALPWQHRPILNDDIVTRDGDVIYESSLSGFNQRLQYRYLRLYTVDAERCKHPHYRFDSLGLRLDRHNYAFPDALPEKSIWMFGGSTVQGLGLEETHSIPALLNEKLKDEGLREYGVINAGQGGFTAQQQLLLLMEMMNAGKRPECVIVYDGINEWPHLQHPGQRLPESNKDWQRDTAFTDQIALMTDAKTLSERARMQEIAEHCQELYYTPDLLNELFANKQRAAKAPPSAVQRYEEKSLRDSHDVIVGIWQPVIAHYLRCHLMMQGVCDSFAVPIYFFFQPVLEYELFYKARQLSEYEDQVLNPKVSITEHFRREVLFSDDFAAERQRFHHPIVDLSLLYAKRDGETLYMDPRHPNAKGNALVAEAIWEEVKSRLQHYDQAV